MFIALINILSQICKNNQPALLFSQKTSRRKFCGYAMCVICLSAAYFCNGPCLVEYNAFDVNVDMFTLPLSAP